MKTPKLISESELNRREKRGVVIIVCVYLILLGAAVYMLTTMFMWG